MVKTTSTAKSAKATLATKTPAAKATAKLGALAKAKPAAKAKPVAKAAKPVENPTPAKAAKPAAKPAAAKPAAAKPAAAKPAAAKPRAPDLLRGAALAEASLEHRRKAEPGIAGMSESEIAGIDLAGKPLSPALRVWLAGDRGMFTLGAPQSITELLDQEFTEFASWFTDLAKYLKEPCVLFDGWGSDSRRFLYLGATDEHGEYPVFTIDTDDVPFACLNGPVDVWLAQQAGALAEEEYYGFVPKTYEPTRAALAKTCFGGYIAHVDGVFSKRLDG